MTLLRRYILRAQNALRSEGQASARYALYLRVIAALETPRPLFHLYAIAEDIAGDMHATRGAALCGYYVEQAKILSDEVIPEVIRDLK